MKEKLYTIPVNEAFDDAGECGFCALNKKLEAEILDYVMGPSYMEEDVRQDMDKMGFCKEHYRQMFGAGNRLGVALMLKSHLAKLNRDTEALFAKELEAKPKRFGKGDEGSPFSDYAETVGVSCYACFRMEKRMQSYVDTFFYLWKTEQEFRDKVLSGKGFCIEHLKQILTEGKRQLNKEKFQELKELLLPLQSKHMKRMEEEVEWFIQKFDYRFKDEPWKNSKDAVERGIQKVAAVQLGDEK